MADEPASLSDDQLETLNLFLNASVGEGGLRCPVSGQDVPFTEWNAPASALVLSGQHGAAGFEVLPLTSPLGGVILISTVKLAEWKKAQDDQAKAAADSGHGKRD